MVSLLLITININHIMKTVYCHSIVSTFLVSVSHTWSSMYGRQCMVSVVRLSPVCGHVVAMLGFGGPSSTISVSAA